MMNDDSGEIVAVMAFQCGGANCY